MSRLIYINQEAWSIDTDDWQGHDKESDECADNLADLLKSKSIVDLTKLRVAMLAMNDDNPPPEYGKIVADFDAECYDVARAVRVKHGWKTEPQAGFNNQVRPACIQGMIVINNVAIPVDPYRSCIQELSVAFDFYLKNVNQHWHHQLGNLPEFLERVYYELKNGEMSELAHQSYGEALKELGH
jgi:hypothetical protein